MPVLVDIVPLQAQLHALYLQAGLLARVDQHHVLAQRAAGHVDLGAGLPGVHGGDRGGGQAYVVVEDYAGRELRVRAYQGAVVVGYIARQRADLVAHAVHIGGRRVGHHVGPGGGHRVVGPGIAGLVPACGISRGRVIPELVDLHAVKGLELRPDIVRADAGGRRDGAHGVILRRAAQPGQGPVVRLGS